MESPSGYAIKINFNGAYNGHNFRSTLGIIARNVEGRVLISCLEIHDGVSTVFLSKLLRVIGRCKWVSKWGGQRTSDGSRVGEGTRLRHFSVIEEKGESGYVTSRKLGWKKL
ncbi:hypothetical protein Goarm_013933, partial [Gossypium armourianum]|nr:hypothetical protein [Gossypium armourianum]